MNNILTILILLSIWGTVFLMGCTKQPAETDVSGFNSFLAEKEMIMEPFDVLNSYVFEYLAYQRPPMTRLSYEIDEFENYVEISCEKIKVQNDTIESVNVTLQLRRSDHYWTAVKIWQ